MRVLERLLASPRAQFLAVYGRRRIGKTFLVRQFFGPRARMFEVIGRNNGRMADNLRVFADALADTFHGGAELVAPASWRAAFRQLRADLERARPSKKKWVLFLDELPWLATHRSGCVEELEHFWNSWCSKQPNIILVVCGSAASWMLKHIIHAHGGLHNRITETLRLLPFELSEVRDFFNARRIHLTHQQIVELYMVLGGVPHYLDKVPRGVSMAQAVDALCFDERGSLTREFDHLFASLFDNDEKYRRIVEELARTKRGVSRGALLAAVGLRSGGGAQRILANLEEAGFIRAFVPFGKSQRNRFYRLMDEFSLFHLHWMRSRRRGKRGDWSSLRGRPAWNAWSGLAFETLCMKHVGLIEHALGISGVSTHVSAWQHHAKGDGDTGAQIDLLIDRADDLISICEMKHTVNPFAVTRRYASELRRKMAVFQQQTGTRKGLQLVLVTSAGLIDNEHARDVVDKHIDLSAMFAGGA